MKQNLISTLLVGAALATAAFGQNGATTSHYSSRGYTQTTYLSKPGLSGMFTITQSAVTSQGRNLGVMVQGNAMGWLPSGNLVTYIGDFQEWNGLVNPTNASLNGTGYVGGWFSARRMEFSFGPGGIQMVSNVPGQMFVESTLENPAFIDRSSDNDHFTLTLPELGMIFSVKSKYGGKIGFEPTGTGAMTFAANGQIESLFGLGTPVNPASWIGWITSSNTEVVSN